MSAKLHIWKGKESDGELAGHGSLELSDGVYISWRRSMFTNEEEIEEISPSTLEDDSNFEGRPPDKSYPVNAHEIDEFLIKQWWQDWKSSRQWKKQGVTTPCFTVLEAIMAGRGWSRREKGLMLDPGDLVNQVAKLGVINRNESCVIQ